MDTPRRQQFTARSPGRTYLSLRWTRSNAIMCTIYLYCYPVNQCLPTNANAGTDINQCNISSFTLCNSCKRASVYDCCTYIHDHDASSPTQWYNRSPCWYECYTSLDDHPMRVCPVRMSYTTNSTPPTVSAAEYISPSVIQDLTSANTPGSVQDHEVVTVQPRSPIRLHRRQQYRRSAVRVHRYAGVYPMVYVHQVR